MNDRVVRSRALYGLLLVSYALSMFALGVFLKWTPWWLGLLFASNELIQRGVALALMPAIVRNCRWLLLRPVIFFEIAGFAGIVGGVWYGHEYPHVVGTRDILVPLLVFGVGSVGLGAAAYFAARGGDEKMPVSSTGFFLSARGHYDDYSARRHLAALFVLVFLITAALTLLLQPDDPASPARAQSFAIGVAVALLLTALQVNPIRGLCFLHFGLLALALGALVRCIAPWADWPATLVGVGAGLPLCGLTTALLMLVPPKQRPPATQIAAGVTILAALLGCLVRFLPADVAGWSVAALGAAAFGLFLRLYFRELAEIIQEIVYWPMYRFKVYGPGLYLTPTRGPVLIIANHGAYFDPLFIAKVMPLRLRAWMISTMFDKPFLKWLAGDVYGAIRVPDRPGFRRHMPEIDQAIEVLKNGENMMIFPEAWLRRKEEQPLHRFAQGIYHILKACPNVPIVPCWIEDSWGTYLSYKNGPPTKGKPFDWFYLIRMGFGEPEVLPPALLEDQKAVRKYLMERVLHCRTYLGLAAYPVPGLTSVEDDKEGEPGNRGG